MRSRHALTAALALSVVTILTVAACGSAVQGAAQVNSAAAETMTGAETTTQRTGRTSIGATDLSSMLNDLQTELPSGLPTDFPSLPSDFAIPGDNGCAAVGAAYVLVLFSVGTAGLSTGNYDATDLNDTLASLAASAPEEIKPDVQIMLDLAAQANGKSAAQAEQLFESSEFKDASDRISTWVNANCG